MMYVCTWSKNPGTGGLESSLLPAEITETVDIVGWHGRRLGPLPILLAVDAREDGQGAAQPALDAELDVGVEPVPDHAGPGPVQVELALDGIHHGLVRLTEDQQQAAHHVG